MQLATISRMVGATLSCTRVEYMAKCYGMLSGFVIVLGPYYCRSDLCIRFKKIFTHEHVLYTPSQLPFHLPSMQRGHRTAPKELIEGGVHPLCEFCRECFFSEDEIYSHMREKHEECFVCKRNEVRDQ